MAGRLIAVDGCAPRSGWPSAEKIRLLLVEASINGGATPLDSRAIVLPLEGVSRVGSLPGGTAWVGLDESHVTLHWYEGEDTVLFALDVFTCGTLADPVKISSDVRRSLGETKAVSSTLNRFL